MKFLLCCLLAITTVFLLLYGFRVLEFEGSENDVTSEEYVPNIYMIESSLVSTINFVNLNARKACAIESAARQNPHLKVLVNILSQNSESIIGNFYSNHSPSLLNKRRIRCFLG